MHTRTRWIAGLLSAGALTAGVLVGAGVSTASPAQTAGHATPATHLTLTPSSAQLAACMPESVVRIKVELTTDANGADRVHVRASGLPPHTAFTIFLLQQADAPFGAAEYIGDITSNGRGFARNAFRLIVQEAFSSNLLNGQRVRTDLNQVGMWFADPAGDDFCLGEDKGPVTPFDGDDAAGVQAFNSLHTSPLPAP